MNQDDWSAFIKAKLDDRNPKCANCRHWDRRIMTAEPPALGTCVANSVHVPVLGDPHISQVVAAYTTDLSLCSAWEKAPTKPDPE